MAGHKYERVGDEEEGAGAASSVPRQRSCMKRIRNCVNSKAVLRILLTIAIILLAGNLFFPARDELRRYGYFLEEERQNGVEMAHVLEPAAFEGVDWSQYAYCQYVTDEDYLCNSVMIFESLSRLEARADRLMMYPEPWALDDSSNAGRLLTKARDEYGVNLVPIEVQHFSGEITWADSFTKLLAFNQTQYKRVLSLDSDATVLQPMDELFLLPSAPVGMPRAYWLDDTLSSQLVLIEPSDFEFNRIEEAFSQRATSDFDMEIVNDLYSKDCFIIPHRKYDLLTGEFKNEDHAKYLGSKEEEWDPDTVFDEAKFLHFSDWPYPKPWIHASESMTAANQPKCRRKGLKQDCRDRDKWLGFYSDFRERRARVCDAPARLAKREDEEVASPPSKYEPIFP